MSRARSRASALLSCRCWAAAGECWGRCRWGRRPSARSFSCAPWLLFLHAARPQTVGFGVVVSCQKIILGVSVESGSLSGRRRSLRLCSCNAIACLCLPVHADRLLPSMRLACSIHPAHHHASQRRARRRTGKRAPSMHAPTNPSRSRSGSCIYPRHQPSPPVISTTMSH